MSIENMSRSTVLRCVAAAAVLALLPFAAAADEMTYTYNVATGACKIIPLPAANIPVHVMAQYSATNDSGMADLTMEWNSFDHVLQWMGLVYGVNSTIQNKSALTGAFIGLLDPTYGGVSLQVQNASHFRVCSALNGVVAHGTVTLVW